MADPKSATPFTEQANQSVYHDPTLNWEDSLDFEFAQRGFVARFDPPVIADDAGDPVWDLQPYGFLEAENAPPTVHPSLWRQARLNMLHGLFKVCTGSEGPVAGQRIYQVRGHDLSVISFIETKTGWIVIDPLISAETARASLQLLYQHIEQKPVVAVIYTHSHVDHYGGVKGIVSVADVEAGQVKIIAPEGFMDAAISENVLAGNVMVRRASYMYGGLLPKSPRGQVDGGLGKTVSHGTVTLIPPTDSITTTGTTLTIDGVEIEFQVTPGTEAPAEMNFYFPQFRALCMAENCSHNLHNLYTLRGAQVRDAKAWAYYLNEAIDRYIDRSDLVFTSHHWPVWGQDRCRDYLKKQRDMYKYLHDQTLRLANHGYTMLEIAEIMALPPSLAREWYGRGYYGSINHNAKAVYQKYLGFFDGNPANLHPLPPQEAGQKYVDLAGGPEALLTKARAAFDQGDYRWVATVVNHLVFAHPDNVEARQLQADALEQLGYQAESGPWRNFYLTGAQELRDGLLKANVAPTASTDVIQSMAIGSFFDYLAVRLNGPKAEGITITINFNFTDVEEQYVLYLENSVLNYDRDRQASHADATLTLTRDTFNEIATKHASFQGKILRGEIKLKGNPLKLRKLFSLLDDFEFWFNIVTP
jgi:alkyl sulfatase BDS1-like metallo-beta-lactamase superfamily hydrolase